MKKGITPVIAVTNKGFPILNCVDDFQLKETPFADRLWI
jgi:hypothetical protein